MGLNGDNREQKLRSQCPNRFEIEKAVALCTTDRGEPRHKWGTGRGSRRERYRSREHEKTHFGSGHRQERGHVDLNTRLQTSERRSRPVPLLTAHNTRDVWPAAPNARRETTSSSSARDARGDG